LKELEIFFRKMLLRIFLLLHRRTKQLPLPRFTRESKILFIRLNRIGDALVSTPLLKEIKDKIGCRIYILASRSNYFVFKNKKIADEIIIYKKDLKGISELLKVLNGIGFDGVVDLHDDVSSTVSYLIAFIKSPHKMGFVKENSGLFTNSIPKPDAETHHIVDRLLEFAGFFNIYIDRSKANIVFEPSAGSLEKAKTFFDKYFPKRKFTIGINISSGSSARFWGTLNFKRIIDELENYDVNLLLLCAEKDVPKALEISERKIPIFYRPEFDEFCAMIPNIDFLITPDTSIVHVASAFKKPVFGLYVNYNTSEQIWSPYKSPFECVITKEATLQNVPFESVKTKLIPFLENCYYEYANRNM
jgi:ADP-heptose:LPS heptosyltransferase